MILKLFFQEEEHSRIAEELFAQPGAIFYVPEIAYLECSYQFMKKMRNNKTWDAKYQATWNMGRLETLGLTPEPVDQYLRRRAWMLLLEYDLGNVFDASYAALASLKGLPLITADGPLATNLGRSHIDVWHIADLPERGWFSAA